MPSPMVGLALVVILVVLLVAVALLYWREREERADREKSLVGVRAELEAFWKRYERVTDVEKEREVILADLKKQRERIITDLENQQAKMIQDSAEATTRFKDLESRIAVLKSEFKALDEEANLRSFGHYRPHYDFADSARYQSKLDEILSAQKEMLKGKSAAVGDIEWAVNGSKKEGQKQINQLLKLMLRSFNGECDAAIAKVHYNNVTVMETRIKKAHEAINGIGAAQGCRITGEYLNLKLQELYLSHEYAEKTQAEKEEQRRIREQMRDEEIAQREFEKARQQAEDEEHRYEMALQKAREEVEKTAGVKHDKLMEQIALMEQKLTEAQANKERAVSRAQMTRSGYVYIISNIGSFGERVFKVGMTRRLDPMDRVRELGDASVPFPFDVHALTFTQDAPALEVALHNAFWERRVNRVNDKREFFNVSIDEIAEVARKHCGDIQITKVAEAEEYRKTLAIRSDRDGVQKNA